MFFSFEVFYANYTEPGNMLPSYLNHKLCCAKSHLSFFLKYFARKRGNGCKKLLKRANTHGKKGYKANMYKLIYFKYVS